MINLTQGLYIRCTELEGLWTDGNSHCVSGNGSEFGGANLQKIYLADNDLVRSDWRLSHEINDRLVINSAQPGGRLFICLVTFDEKQHRFDSSLNWYRFEV